MELSVPAAGWTAKTAATATLLASCLWSLCALAQSDVMAPEQTGGGPPNGLLVARRLPNGNASLPAEPGSSSVLPLPPTLGLEDVPTPPASFQYNFSGQPTPLTLNQVLELALNNNPTLRQAAARIDSQRGIWIQQGLYPNPRVAYKADEIGDDNAAGFQGFIVGQEIVTTGKLKKAQNVAAQQIAQAQQEYNVQQIRVQNDVKVRFYNILIAQRAVELNQELVQISRNAAKAADDLFRAAQVARSDVLQAQVEADLIEVQTIKAQNALLSAWRQLAVVIAQPELVPQQLAGDLQQDIINTTWEQAWTCIYSASPELAAAQAKLAAARCAIEKARADRFQNWDIEGGYAHDNATGFDTGGITITIPLPVYNRNQGGITQAEADAHAAQAEVDRVALDLRNRLALVFERYSNAKVTVDRYEKSILPNARQSIELTSHRYQAGESNYPAVLLAQRVFLQTQVSYLDALRELRETSTLLQGMLLSDSLASVGK
jgi:cobalt-zinc-cadmium efflux system outer membrane protein